MKLLSVLVATSAAAAHAADVNPLILGGTIVPAGTKTYTVGLRDTAAGESWCGGSLITPTHVLSAGHCSGARYVAVGTHFLSGSSDGERIRVIKETVHPNYNDNTLNNDYTILELARPATVKPVSLYSGLPATFAGATATVMGWGHTKEKGTASTELLRVNVPVYTDAACKAAGLSGRITLSMFCAGGRANRDSCQGDSGGPLIIEDGANDVLVGVVSWGDGCGVANSPGVYSSVARAKNWILSVAPNATFV